MSCVSGASGDVNNISLSENFFALMVLFRHSFPPVTLKSRPSAHVCPEIISQNNQEHEQAHPLLGSPGRLVGARQAGMFYENVHGKPGAGAHCAISVLLVRVISPILYTVTTVQSYPGVSRRLGRSLRERQYSDHIFFQRKKDAPIDSCIPAPADCHLCFAGLYW
jgi:hypothetical protein